MFLRITLSVLIPFLLLTQSVLMLHVHNVEHAAEHGHAPHIHLHDAHHHSHSHHHDDSTECSSACEDDSQHQPADDAIYVLCHQVSFGHRLVLSDIKTGVDFLICVSLHESALVQLTSLNVLSIHENKRESLLVDGPAVIRNSLLRI